MSEKQAKRRKRVEAQQAAQNLGDARQLAALLRDQVQKAADTATALRGYGWAVWFDFKGPGENYKPTVRITPAKWDEL